MKQFVFLLTGLLPSTFLFSQQLIANKYPAWGQPVIKRLIAKDPTVTGYGVKGNDRFINIAALDRTSKILYWISCEGYIIEASQLTDADYKLVASNKADPFQLYQLLYQKDLQITDNAIDKLRFPENKFYSKSDPGYDLYLSRLIKAKRIDTLPNPDQKLAALYKDEQNYLYHLDYIQAGHPLKVKPDSIYRTILSQVRKGSIKVSEHTDSMGTAEFYNKDGLSPVYKAILDIPSATLYFCLTDQSVFDSISINRKQILKLINEGTDVFTLYQNYTLWQLCMLDSTVRQLHDYYAKTNPGAKEKQAVQYLLAGFGGSKEALIGKLQQLEEKTLLKLKRLFDVDEGNLEQGLWSSFKYSTVPVRYGQYIEGRGLVISDPVPPYSPPVVYSQTRGNKLYELTDQRGNVMVVVSDKKIQYDDNGDNMVDYYTADVVNATDYSPFGKPLPGRMIEMRDYKYGYNGKENDVETGYQNYGFRMYDPNLARFISVDPLTKQYPGLTPYQFASNRPIWGTDRDGKEFQVNSWLWDIWMKFEFGDPTGIKALKKGYEEKAAITTHQMSYHNDQVPADIQNRLDKEGTLDANMNIAKGISKLTAFNIKTSFDVLSMIAPIGEGISVSLKGAEIVYGGIRAERVLVGSSEKIAVIGRDFDARVLKFAAGFEKETGKAVETFQASNAAKAEWGKLLSKYNGDVPEDVAKISQIYKENSAWAQKVKKEGYKVLDTGLGTKDAKGTFYKMETQTIFGDKK